MKLRILGLDNSRYSTGWAIIDVNTDDIEFLTKQPSEGYKEGMKIIDYGYIDTSSIKEEGKTLIYIENAFTDIIRKYKPDAISAEQMFVGSNKQVGVVLSGIHAIMKLVAAKANIPITYYSIMTIKSSVLGGMKLKKDDGTRKTGDEMKIEVANKVIDIFGKERFKDKLMTDDVTDAISCVITYKNYNGVGVGKQSANHKKKSSKKKALNGSSKGKITSKKSTKKASIKKK